MDAASWPGGKDGDAWVMLPLLSAVSIGSLGDISIGDIVVSATSRDVDGEGSGVDSDIDCSGWVAVLLTKLLRSLRLPRMVPFLRDTVGGACYNLLAMNDVGHALSLTSLVAASASEASVFVASSPIGELRMLTLYCGAPPSDAASCSAWEIGSSV